MGTTNDVFNSEVFGKRNFDALDDIYTTDARILPPGAPMISGREAIKEFWSNLIQSVNARSAALASIDVMSAGDGVVELGRATLKVGPEGQATTEMEVKYVVYWRQEDGRWKWHVDIWNQNLLTFGGSNEPFPSCQKARRRKPLSRKCNFWVRAPKSGCRLTKYDGRPIRNIDWAESQRGDNSDRRDIQAEYSSRPAFCH
jgi:ketosteroid isomerase-like protein